MRTAAVPTATPAVAPRRRASGVRAGRFCASGFAAVLLDFLVLVLASSTAFLEARAREADELHTIESIAACSEVEPPPAAHQGLSAGDHLLATPPNSQGPTLVDLGLFIVDITRISEVDNTFRIQGFIDLVWCDPRLAFDPEAMGSEEEEFLEHNAACFGFSLGGTS